MSKSADGKIIMIDRNDCEVHIELVMCQNCLHYKPKKSVVGGIGSCQYWGKPTPKGGFCFAADRRKEKNNGN